MAQFVKGNTLGRKFPAGAAQTETARKGGIACAEKRRRVKSLREALDILLNKEFKDEAGETKFGYELVGVGLFEKAKDGDPRAVKLLSELMGEYMLKADITSAGKSLNVSVQSEKVKSELEKLGNQ